MESIEYWEGVLMAAKELGNGNHPHIRAYGLADNAMHNILRLKASKEIRDTLISSIEKCGGDVGSIMNSIDDGMTVTELLQTLGPNGVRFTVTDS